MAALRTLAAAAAALSLVGQGHAWTVSLPPCLDPFQPFVYSGCYNDVTKPDTLSFKSDLPSDGMTVEKCVAECKGNGYRYAGLEYYGECYCGATVNGPAAPEGECNLPCNGNNTQHCGGNDRISIYQDPTFKPVDQSTIQDYRHLGCYTGDSADGSKSLAYPVEDITGQPWDQSTATTTKCLTLCKSKGFPFAGTEYGRECYCGVVMGNGTQSTDMGECNMPCNGNSSETCGGPSRINIWVSKELESLEPCGYVPPVSSSSSSSVETSTSTTSSSSSTSSSSTWYTTSTSSTWYTTSTSYSSSSSSTRPPMTTTTPSTTAPPKTSTTTTSSAVCTTTVVLPPKCEYKCGNWCSEELPDWEDQDDCKASQNNCKLQVAACFKKAGWPGAIECFGFQKWCSDGANYCKGTNKGCSKNDWFKQKPPVYGGKPTTSTITVPCKPTAGPTTTSKSSTRSTTSKSSTRSTTSKPSTPSTTSKPSTPSTTSKCPIPTVTNICKQPTNPKYGYSPENPVGGIDLPVVTCNDIKKDYQSGNQWKLYTDSDSSKCRSYPHSGVPNACQDACKEQFDDCNDVYAQGCKNNQPGKPAGPPGWPWKRAIAGRTVTWTDSYSAAVDKCKAQYNDCLAINRGVSYGGKCSAFGKGW